MGSDDDRKKKKKDKKKDRKKSRDRRDRDRYSDSDSSESQEVRRKKKIKKSQDKDNGSFAQPKYMYGQEHGRQHFPFPPAPFFMPHMMDIAPPPPTAPTTTTLAKPTKNKEPNIFKLLPILPPSIVTLCNCIYSTQLLGAENLEVIIGRLWKMLDKKLKPLATKRITKIINEGMAMHEKLISNKDKDNMQVPLAIEVPKQQPYTDFDIVAAIYQKTPLQDIRSMLGPGSIFTEKDLEATVAN